MNVALLRLSEIYDELSPDLKRKVIPPPYKRIITVERELDEDDPTSDIFYAYFENHAYAWALQMLSIAKKTAQMHSDKSLLLTELFAILNRLKNHDEQKEKFDKIILDLDEPEKLAIRYIIEHKYAKVELGIESCIGLVNFIVQKFINL